MTSIKERTEIARESKRDIPQILKEIQVLATLNNEVALSCFYVVFDKIDNKPFVGISVRFAELIASSWSNIHTGAKITSNNGMNITVQGFVHDFEKNAVFTVEVHRNISKLSAERIIQATNAASSIAFRNAVFKAIPAAITYSITKNIRQYIVENIDGGSVVKDILKYFGSKGVQEQDLTNLIGCEIEDIDSDKLFLLIGLKNAIEEGDTTIAEVFKIGKVETPLRKSKFSWETKELTDDEIIQVQKVNKKIAEALEITKPKVIEEITIELFPNEEITIELFPKNNLKNQISLLAKENKTEQEIDLEFEEPKQIEKKRGRGRPKK